MIFLCQVFSAFGPVLKIAMFDKNGGLQALIQYPGKIVFNLKSINCFYFVCPTNFVNLLNQQEFFFITPSYPNLI